MIQKRAAGFTVVEIIIVITCIAVLGTIGLISYSGSVNRTKKSNYNSNAQQVKLKLGEYFTDNNTYPANKAAVTAYLSSVGSTTISTEFATSAYVYTPAPASCSTACTSYTITVAKSNWSGGSGETDLSIPSS